MERDSKVVHYMWNDYEKMCSSTWREIKAILVILESLQTQLSGKLVKVYTDNQNAVRIICKGSMKEELHQLAMRVFGLCVKNAVQLELEWIPRNLNTYADELSKIFDYDDWGISERIFNFFNIAWGEFTCDLFADSKNFKVKKYFTRFWSPGSSGVDAFAQNWADENCWIVPPPSLICRVLRHLQLCNVFGTMVIPKWKSALYWPLIWNTKSNSFKSFIKNYFEYERPYNFFTEGSDKNSIFAMHNFPSNVLVLHVDFRH